ncbi:MAG: hypothetical protein ACE5HI_10530 [bacterium]
MKAIKVLILSALLVVFSVGGWGGPAQVTAHKVGTPPPEQTRISVNTCNGVIVGYKAPYVYGITATHCIKAPMNMVMVSYGEIWIRGEKVKNKSDLSYIRWQAPEPKYIVPLSKELPKPGEGVWVAGSIRGDYLPVPGIWLGNIITYGDIETHTIYGNVALGFSGSPVLNTDGELIGIISLGMFMDSRGSTSIIAPWAGVSILPYLEKNVEP